MTQETCPDARARFFSRTPVPRNGHSSALGAKAASLAANGLTGDQGSFFELMVGSYPDARQIVTSEETHHTNNS